MNFEVLSLILLPITTLVFPFALGLVALNFQRYLNAKRALGESVAIFHQELRSHYALRKNAPAPLEADKMNELLDRMICERDRMQRHEEDLLHGGHLKPEPEKMEEEALKRFEKLTNIAHNANERNHQEMFSNYLTFVRFGLPVTAISHAHIAWFSLRKGFHTREGALHCAISYKGLTGAELDNLAPVFYDSGRGILHIDRMFMSASEAFDFETGEMSWSDKIWHTKFTFFIAFTICVWSAIVGYIAVPQAAPEPEIKANITWHGAKVEVTVPEVATQAELVNAFLATNLFQGADVEVATMPEQVDILTEAFAVKVDRIEEWHRAIGQVLHYAQMTGRSPLLALYAGDKEALTHYKDAVVKVCQAQGVGIIFMLPERETADADNSETALSKSMPEELPASEVANEVEP